MINLTIEEKRAYLKMTVSTAIKAMPDDITDGNEDIESLFEEVDTFYDEDLLDKFIEELIRGSLTIAENDETREAFENGISDIISDLGF